MEGLAGMLRFRRAVLWILVLAALGVGGYALSRKLSPGPQAVRFETLPVDQGSIVSTVTASGTLSALVTVQVGSQVSGRIQEILVDFNSIVKKGQVIARIDPQMWKAAVAQARASWLATRGELSKARVQVAEATRQRDRAKALLQKQLFSQADFDTAQASVDAAKAQVEADEGKLAQARAALDQAEINLAQTTIVSPKNGVVISRAVDVGQTVAASFQTPTLFTIAEDLRQMQVDTSVAEADIGKLTAGMKATFTVDAYPAERFLGTVRQIRNAAQTTQNVVTYDAVIDVANPDLKLRPGMTANVTFVYAERSRVKRVSNAALRFRPTPEVIRRARTSPAPPPPGWRVVWALRAKQPVAVPIRTGISDGRLTEVVAGDLRDGDRVIIDVTSGAGAGGGPGGGGPPKGGPPRPF
jgi:HlyD family secretion protein